MEYFSLYKKGRYGWIHVTSYKSENLFNAIEYFKKEFSIKIGEELFNYKVERECSHDFQFNIFKTDIVCKKCNVSKYLL